MTLPVSIQADGRIDMSVQAARGTVVPISFHPAGHGTVGPSRADDVFAHDLDLHAVLQRFSSDRAGLVEYLTPVFWERCNRTLWSPVVRNEDLEPQPLTFAEGDLVSFVEIARWHLMEVFPTRTQFGHLIFQTGTPSQNAKLVPDDSWETPSGIDIKVELRALFFSTQPYGFSRAEPDNPAAYHSIDWKFQPLTISVSLDDGPPLTPRIRQKARATLAAWKVVTFSPDGSGWLPSPRWKRFSSPIERFRHVLDLQKLLWAEHDVDMLMRHLAVHFWRKINPTLTWPLRSVEDAEPPSIVFSRGHRDTFDHLIHLALLSEPMLEKTSSERILVISALSEQRACLVSEIFRKLGAALFLKGYVSERMVRLVDVFVQHHTPWSEYHRHATLQPDRACLEYSLEEAKDALPRERLLAAAELRQWLEQHGYDPIVYGFKLPSIGPGCGVSAPESACVATESAS